MGENENFSDAAKEGMKNAQEIQNNAGSSYQGLDAAEGATSELVTPSQQPQNAGSRPNPFDNMQNVGAESVYEWPAESVYGRGKSVHERSAESIRQYAEGSRPGKSIRQHAGR